MIRVFSSFWTTALIFHFLGWRRSVTFPLVVIFEGFYGMHWSVLLSFILYSLFDALHWNHISKARRHEDESWRKYEVLRFISVKFQNWSHPMNISGGLLPSCVRLNFIHSLRINWRSFFPAFSEVFGKVGVSVYSNVCCFPSACHTLKQVSMHWISFAVLAPNVRSIIVTSPLQGRLICLASSVSMKLRSATVLKRVWRVSLLLRPYMHSLYRPC